MLSPLLLLTALLSFTSAQYSNPNNGHTTNPGLVASLKTAATRYDRDQLLKEDTDWWYDAYKHPNFNNANGGVVTVDVSKLPALEGAGVSIAMIRMGPCSMLPIHEHPWANNLVYGIKGNVTSWMVGDDGDRVHTVNIYENIATLFPQGSIHGMQNEGCSEAVIMSALSSHDSGTNYVFKSSTLFPDDFLRANLGGIDAASFKAKVPKVGTGVIPGSAACRRRCNIKS